MMLAGSTRGPPCQPTSDALLCGAAREIISAAAGQGSEAVQFQKGIRVVQLLNFDSEHGMLQLRQCGNTTT